MGGTLILLLDTAFSSQDKPTVDSAWLHDDLHPVPLWRADRRNLPDGYDATHRARL